MRGSLVSRFLVCQRDTHWGRGRPRQGAVFPQKPRLRSVHRGAQRGRVDRSERQQPGEGLGGCTITVASARRGERTPKKRLVEPFERTNLGGKRANAAGERTTGARREQDVLVHAAGMAKNRGTGRLEHPGETQPGQRTRRVSEQATVIERLVGAEKRVIPTITPRFRCGVGGITPTASGRQTWPEPARQRRRRGRGKPDDREIVPVHEPDDPKPNHRGALLHTQPR